MLKNFLHFFYIYIKSLFKKEKRTIYQYCKQKYVSHVNLQAIHVHSQIRQAFTGHVRRRIQTLTWSSKQVLFSGIGLWDEEQQLKIQPSGITSQTTSNRGQCR